MASALGGMWGINPESQKILMFLWGQRTAEQMIQEYFGLRKEVIYSDDGETVIDMINEFRDPTILKFKKVRYNAYFASKWLTEEMFYKIVPRDSVYVEPVEPIVTLVQDDKDTTSTWTTQEEPVVSRPRGRAKKVAK